MTTEVRNNYLDTDLHDPELLLASLIDLRESVWAEGQQLFEKWKPLVSRRAFLVSGLNLCCYLALRRRDLRPLQAALPPWGLSSLGRSESRVIENLDAVIATLKAICNEYLPIDRQQVPIRRPSLHGFTRGPRMLEHNAEMVLGPEPERRRVRIMVTMPSTAAHPSEGFEFIVDLLERGMSVARINCAHDDKEAWAQMIDNIRRAGEATSRSCRVLMDLGGPKVRTGKVYPQTGREAVQAGDRILVTRGELAERPDVQFQTSCTLPAALDQVEVGHGVFFDDGLIGGRVIELAPDGLVIEVEQAGPDGTKLRKEKGINFPDTVLGLDPLTEKDLEDLDFIVHHADGVNYSFVQEPQDIDRLQAEIRKRLPNEARFEQFAVVAKIETRRAVRNLPELIAHAAGRQPFGVMIARGDLAVEIGFNRLAEMQEQIMWICEAAHVPVIWATQVFEGFAKSGVPSRAEVTDAAMSERAECVMLNKGPYIGEVVTMLDDVLARMQAHQIKKTPQLRELKSWADLLE